ncbi:hypothetical protein BKA62DRAFT_833448 [Auriculariales sp. MPI-PUGE-AT-0066]|nr:hypothetical protein BKA62DRAFT_833448 [Auriculariales sp. MPI-PUGE-AT-0066]
MARFSALVVAAFFALGAVAAPSNTADLVARVACPGGDLDSSDCIKRALVVRSACPGADLDSADCIKRALAARAACPGGDLDAADCIKRALAVRHACPGSGDLDSEDCI